MASELLFDVVSGDGRILNEVPLPLISATCFSLDADIDSEETSSVVPSRRKRSTHLTRWCSATDAVKRVAERVRGLISEKKGGSE